MTEAKFKNMRHIETVRNYLNGVVIDLLRRGEMHDQSKLHPPESRIFEKYTAKLRQTSYGSEEYFQYLDEMQPALKHHNEMNRHHPDFHDNGIEDMNLIDLIEMLLDWKAATLRHDDGDVYHSIEFNQERFGYSDEMKFLLRNTMQYIDLIYQVKHSADES